MSCQAEVYVVLSPKGIEKVTLASSEEAAWSTFYNLEQIKELKSQGWYCCKAELAWSTPCYSCSI